MPSTLLGTFSSRLLDLLRLNLDGFVVDKDTLALIPAFMGHSRSASTTPSTHKIGKLTAPAPSTS